MTEEQGGVQLDPDHLIGVLNQKVGAGAIREAQLEAAIMQLQQEKQQLETTLEALKTAADEAAGDPVE